MRIDPKYFNTFLLIVALIGASLIAFFMLNNRSAERSDFSKRMMAQDSLKTVWWPKVQSSDSLRISDFRGQIVVLDFWSGWSNTSIESHRELTQIVREHPQKIEVIAAAVRLRKDDVVSYIEEHSFPFHFVAGSQQFSAFHVPGLPAQMIYNSEGDIRQVFLGYPGKSQYDSLRAMVSDGE